MTRFLADENFPLPTVLSLRQAGFDISAIIETTARMSDPDVLRRAVSEGRVLLTCDKDFGELVFRAGMPANCGVIPLRLPSLSQVEFTRAALKALSTKTAWQGMFAVVTAKNIRLRKMPQTP